MISLIEAIGSPMLCVMSVVACYVPDLADVPVSRNPVPAVNAN